MNVLVIGSGGREHALAWKLGESKQVDRVYCAPGNPNMAGVQTVPLHDISSLADFAANEQIGLTVVGPEAPLCAGIVDVFRERGLPIFGPSGQAAQLEGSKAFAKDFMRRHGIPTAAATVCETLAQAEQAIRELGAPVVVKADGLAAGKGVIVADREEEALQAARDCFEGHFGEAGSRVVVEECLVGEEASILALTDGRTIVPLASSQDHKRIADGDLGPNTGGMGAYSPAPVVTDQLWQEISRQVLDPFLAGCQADGLDYRGVIYAGIMVTPDGLRVLEFNVRFGDPETQAVLARLGSDLCDAMLAVIDRRLDTLQLTWSPEPAVCVVMAAGGYPGNYRKGDVIHGIADAEATGALVFHAGTAQHNGEVVTAGGRVLGVTARGEDIGKAVSNAYRAVECISWEGVQYRRDIAHRAMARQRAEA
jgi:phosphoribosylamine--glycine ligase